MRREIKRIFSIILQIILLQCIYTLPLIISVMFVPIETKMEFIFSYKSITLENWYYLLIYIVNILPTSIGIRFIVQKYKKCWDYAITIYLIHYVFIVLSTNTFIPTITWSIVHIVSGIITIVFSEYLCKQHEMKDITFTNTQLITPIPLKSIEIDHIE